MRSQKIYRIFVSGPSDVAEDIEIARETISEISMLTAPMGFQFETFFWANDATPGIDLEPQARINDQISAYDGFIAILGSKLGSPTKEFESGTVEEIERAIASYEKRKFLKDSIMILFKEIDLNSSSPNLLSVIKVQEFRNSIGSRGILFKDFKEHSELRSHILRSFGLIISRHIISGGVTSEYTENTNPPQSEPELPLEAEEEQDPHSDLGLIDLDELTSIKMKRSTEIAQAISAAVSELGERVSSLTEELQIATQIGNTQEIKRIVNLVSNEMNDCAGALEKNTPQLQDSFQSSMESAKKLLEIRLSDFHSEGSEDPNIEMVEAISGTLATSKQNIIIFDEFQQNLQSVPRLTKEVNLSKRYLLKEIGNLISVFETIEKECEDFIKFYQAL